MAGYAVKEMFLTLQGEGINAGRRALFIRFAGCNLWSGQEKDREGADCTFCDTDFVGMDGEHGGRYPTADALADTAIALWSAGIEEESCTAFVVLTGGEPLLQLDDALIAALKRQGFEIAIESNGTIAVPPGIDWICISPKAGTETVQTSGNELKVVFPQPLLDFKAMEQWDFDHFLISPMDGTNRRDAAAAAIAFVIRHPRWRLSTQTHKALGLR